MFLQNIGYTAVLLGVLVFVHEFGHFIVAKSLGVKVLRFSIGFGPRIFGFTWGETEYRVAWIPLGGYVKMAGELPYEELSPEDAKRGFLAQAPWKRALIVLAGPGFNLLFPILVYFCIFYFGTHDVLSTRVGSVEPGLPAAEAHLEPGDRIVAVEGEPVRTFEELRNALQPKFNQPVSLTVDRSGKTFDAKLTPTKAVDSDPFETVQRGMIGISPAARPPLLGVPAGSPAAAAGFETFDQVLAINGQPIRDEGDLATAVRQAQGKLDVAVARAKPLGLPGLGLQAPEVKHVQVDRQPGEGDAALGAESADLYVENVEPGSAAEAIGIKRGDRLVAVDGHALESFTRFRLVIDNAGEKPVQLTWRRGTEDHTAPLRETKLQIPDDQTGQAIAVLTSGIDAAVPILPSGIAPDTVRVNMGVLEATKMSLRVVPEVIRKTAIAFGFIFTGKVPFQSLGGPVMLYQLAKKSAAEGLDSFLNVMAVISVNLGIINLLPIPILDGFHLFAAAWEGVRRRPIPMRAREIANMVGLAMLALLMVLVLRNDFMR